MERRLTLAEAIKHYVINELQPEWKEFDIYTILDKFAAVMWKNGYAIGNHYYFGYSRAYIRKIWNEAKWDLINRKIVERHTDDLAEIYYKFTNSHQLNDKEYCLVKLLPQDLNTVAGRKEAVALLQRIIHKIQSYPEPKSFMDWYKVQGNR